MMLEVGGVEQGGFTLFCFHYVHGKQLRSCRYGQLLNHSSWASLPDAVYQYLVHIFSTVIDNLNKWKRKKIFLG